MSKNKNNRNILIVFAVLLVAVGVNELVKSIKGERTFRKDIIEFKANDIRKFSIYPKNSGNRMVDVYLEDTVWKLKFDGKLFAADQDMIKGIIDELGNMKPDKLVANTKDQWKDYDITDSTGTKLTIYGPKKEKADLTFGRFSYNQATRKPSSFVRVGSEKEVYSVEGYLGMTFNREINSLRDKIIFRGNQNDLQQITFTYQADSSFSLTKEGNKWSAGGVPCDSTSIASYLNIATYMVAADFRDDFIPASAPTEICKVVFTGQNMKPVEIKAYKDAKGTVLNSSSNSTTYFSGDQGNLFAKLFQGKAWFTTPKPPKSPKPAK